MRTGETRGQSEIEGEEKISKISPAERNDGSLFSFKERERERDGRTDREKTERITRILDRRLINFPRGTLGAKNNAISQRDIVDTLEFSKFRSQSLQIIAQREPVISVRDIYARD